MSNFKAKHFFTEHELVKLVHSNCCGNSKVANLQK
jgi:hypothetical protein